MASFSRVPGQSSSLVQDEMGVGLMGVGLMGAGITVTPGPDQLPLADTARNAHPPAITTHDKLLLRDSVRSGFRPAGGPSGLHDYEVIVCDKFGSAYGQIVTAVITDVEWELDDIGSVTFAYWVFDPSSAALPQSSFPGGREIQIWRDQKLIWWGWPIDSSVDATAVQVSCSGFFWAYNSRLFGPILNNYLQNPNFQSSPTSFAPWAEFGPGISAEIADATGGFVLDGTFALRMQATGSASCGVTQEIDMTAFTFDGGIDGLLFNFAVWVYVDDPGLAPVVGAAFNLGLWVNALDGSSDILASCADSISDSTPKNQWFRLAGSFNWPPGATILQFNLFAPVGITYWNRADASYEEDVNPHGGVQDVTGIIEGITTYAQSPQTGKTDLNMAFAGADTEVDLLRQYPFSSNNNIFQAIQEFSSIGACDYEVTWDTTGHFRTFTVFPGQKGTVRYNHPLALDVGFVTSLAAAITGSQVGTAQRVLGQGATGSSAEIGYSAFPALIGEGDGVGFPGSNLPRVLSGCTVTETTLICPGGNFTVDDVGQGLFDAIGFLAIGTVVLGILSDSEVLFNDGSTIGSRVPINTGMGVTVGIGGVIIDQSQSALTGAPVGSLQGTAEGWLALAMNAQLVPTCTLRADGPEQILDHVTVGDIVPVQINYGWLQIGGTPGSPYLMRVTKITLHPVTEEVILTLNVIPQPAISSQQNIWTLDDPVLGLLDSGNVLA